jgi:hypothetical protein
LDGHYEKALLEADIGEGATSCDDHRTTGHRMREPGACLQRAYLAAVAVLQAQPLSLL